jgi:hypothetical protein
LSGFFTGRSIGRAECLTTTTTRNPFVASSAQPKPEAPKPAATPPPLSTTTPGTVTVPVSRFSAEASKANVGLARVGYLLSAALLIPLVFSLLSKDDDVKQRIEATARHYPEVFQKLDAAEDATVEDLFEALPEHRFEGAFLARETMIHWLFALMSAIGFFALAWFFFERGGASAMHLVFVAAFTATVGIASLLMFQYAADLTQGVWVRGRGVVTLLFYIVKFIGFSYNAASDPEAGFWLSFLGFTCGVGLCAGQSPQAHTPPAKGVHLAHPTEQRGRLGQFLPHQRGLEWSAGASCAAVAEPTPSVPRRSRGARKRRTAGARSGVIYNQGKSLSRAFLERF